MISCQKHRYDEDRHGCKRGEVAQGRFATSENIEVVSPIENTLTAEVYASVQDVLPVNPWHRYASNGGNA